MIQDLRFAFRLFARQRGFFALAVMTLALGIGLTTTIFSVADNLLFRPLPYPEPQRLYQLFGAARKEGQSRVSAALGDLVAWRSTGALTAIGAFGPPARVSLAGGRDPRRVTAAPVDEHFLEALGVQPILGRAFT